MFFLFFFYSFPLGVQHADRLRRWLVNITRQDWEPSKSSHLCSLHFEDHEFTIDTYVSQSFSWPTLCGDVNSNSTHFMNTQFIMLRGIVWLALQYQLCSPFLTTWWRDLLVERQVVIFLSFLCQVLQMRRNVKWWLLIHQIKMWLVSSEQLHFCVTQDIKTKEWCHGWDCGEILKEDEKVRRVK